MIFERLTLLNFGSYENETIDLTDLPAAAVTGPNGAGKSTAFVDAPLWALTGKCRTATDDMLHTGADAMAVGLDMTVSGQTYRVLRKRSLKTKAGKSDLSVSVRAGDDWTPVATGVDQAQAWITRILGADYHTLTSSCFLVQGKADQFSCATPGERKTILAAILRLDQYAELKAMAAKQAIEAVATATAKREESARLRLQADLLPGLLARKQDLQRNEAAMQTALRHELDGLAALREEEPSIRTTLAEIAAVVSAGGVDVDRRKRLDAGRFTLRGDLDRAKKIVANAATIRAKVAEEAELEAQQAALALRERDLGPTEERLEHDLEAAQGAVTALGMAQRELERTDQFFSQKKRDLETEERRVRTMIAQAEQKVALLGRVPCGADLQAQCEFTRNAVLAQVELPRLYEQLSQGGLETPDLEAARATRVALGAQVDGLKQGAPEQTVSRLQAERAVLRKQRTDLVNQRTSLSAQIAHCRTYTVRVPELDNAERDLPRLAADRAQMDGEITAIDDRLRVVHERLAAQPSIQRRLDDVLALIGAAAVAITRLNAEGMVRAGQMGALTSDMAAAEAAKTAWEQMEPVLAALDVTQRQWLTLRDAYGLIPTLILENAIPFVEQAANTILGKITRTGMRVSLETQKATKSRDTLSETLDILIRDDLGERRYENFSGGEKFRIDLALRVALSKLLANRAGARLETLVIDEGLGSLDEDGLAQLRDCLAALTEDFARVIVVTHVDEMKTTFPAQIVVSKNGTGSRVAVLS